jgi:GNAT superfamily N-acetyltransferase
MAADGISVRPAEDGDRRLLALLLAAVAEERDGIAAEPPVDVDRLATSWQVDGTLVALSDGVIVGQVRVDPSWMGFGEIGMMVAADWRGRGVGTSLVAAAVEWARAHGLHKLALSVFPITTPRSPCTASSASSKRDGLCDTSAAPMVNSGT